METIGKLLSNNRAELEYHTQGFIYKNWDAYENKLDEICYIPEYGVDEDSNIINSYTYKDFERIASEFVKNNEEVQKYLNINRYSEEVIADELFNSVD